MGHPHPDPHLGWSRWALNAINDTLFTSHVVYPIYRDVKDVGRGDFCFKENLDWISGATQDPEKRLQAFFRVMLLGCCTSIKGP